MDDKYNIPILGKTFAIIEKVAGNPDGISFINLVKSLNQPKTTIFRILYTLEKQNWIEKKGDLYFLGYMFIHYGLLTLSRRDLRNIARPYMQELSDTLQVTSHVAVMSGKHSMILEVFDTPHHIKPSSVAGALLPLHCTSHGKILLAFAVKEPLETFLEDVEMEKKTENTITTISALEKEVDNVRQCGYAMDNLEYFPDIRCLAAPLWGPENECLGALGITATAVSFPENEIDRYAEIVMKTATAVSREMGATIR